MNNYLLITGASSGIGRQCAIQLSEKYNLILCARREDKLQETRRLCQTPEKHLVFVCDLEQINDIEKKLEDFLIQNDCCIDKFLHCAGTLTLLPAKSFDVKICQSIFNVNLFSAMSIVKILLRKQNKKALKNIIFISALYSKKAVIGNSIYAASKGALDSYMRCLAKELAPQIRVNSILPGGIKTDITATMSEEQLNEIEKSYPLGFGKTDDIANMVDFLFSDKAKWITGQQISVDGGASI